AQYEPHSPGSDHAGNHRSGQRSGSLITMANIGKVSQVIGPAVDVEFEEGKQPAIYQALHITSRGFNVPDPIDVIVEVQQHLGEGRVRCVELQPTEGMVRGNSAEDSGVTVFIPVGKSTFGRGIKLLGERD